jgi:hypothetical protein
MDLRLGLSDNRMVQLGGVAKSSAVRAYDGRHPRSVPDNWPAPLLTLLMELLGQTAGPIKRQLADAARERRPNLNVLFITGFARNGSRPNEY